MSVKENDIVTNTFWEPGLAKVIQGVLKKYAEVRCWHRFRTLRKLGMHLGANVNLPPSVWIDTSHCHLISIGDWCGFGEGCCILAHDALANQFLDATRIGRVIIHNSCHIGARTVILPGVEIGPQAIIGAGSVVTRSIPSQAVAVGNPARVIYSLNDYLEKHRAQQENVPNFPYEEADVRSMNEVAKNYMRKLLKKKCGYIMGGYSANVK